MELFYQICEWGLIVALVLFVIVIIYLVATALHFKTAVIGHAKRLYERPVNSVKSLAATGKAVAQQEKVRVQHMAGTFKGTAGDVKETATEVKSAAQSVHPAELKAALTNVQHAFRFLSAVAQFARATSKQGPSRIKA
ncbi:MAG: hypothetical protein JO250_10660 [Armatimonadetes bacterium]|nr:hypothetical protein [Armatimonadota bacterium]